MIQTVGCTLSRRITSAVHGICCINGVFKRPLYGRGQIFYNTFYIDIKDKSIYDIPVSLIISELENKFKDIGFISFSYIKDDTIVGNINSNNIPNTLVNKWFFTDAIDFSSF